MPTPRVQGFPAGSPRTSWPRSSSPPTWTGRPTPAYRLTTLVLIRCGLRISSAAGLAFNCTVTDANGAPYLRYYNTKMKRETLVPIDDELYRQIGEQQQRALRFPAGAPVLFPRQTGNLNGASPSPAILTAARSTAGWQTATSTTEHGTRST
jgi:integrase